MTYKQSNQTITSFDKTVAIQKDKPKKKPTLVFLAGFALVLFALCFALTQIIFRPKEEIPEPIIPIDSEIEVEPEPVIEEEPKPVVKTREDGCTYMTYDGHEMLIVNKQYSIPEAYGDELGEGLNPDAQQAFSDMQSAASEAGYSIWVGSGRRSYKTQESTYAFWVSMKGEAEANRVSAKPGTSEHQTGLAIDIRAGNDDYYLSKKFETTAEFEWLYEHSAEYGFILRYLKDKEEITGYDYEPWHFRYVGSELARIITDSGLTVEEFAGLA